MIFMKKIFLILLLMFTVVACDLEKAERAYDNGEYIKSIRLTLNYFEKNPNKINKIKPEMKNSIMEKFSNIINHYRMKTGSSDLAEKQLGYEGLYKIYALADVYPQSANFTDFTSKYDGDELLNEIQKLMKERIKKSKLEDYGYSKVISELDNIYNGTLYFTKGLTEIKTISPEKKIKYELISKNLAKSKTDKMLDIADFNEKNESYRIAQKLNEEAQKIYGSYQQNYRNMYSKVSDLKYKADYEDAKVYYKSALSKASYAKTRSDYRNVISDLQEARKIIPNFENTSSLISKYSDKAYVKYSIFGCSDTFVEKYLVSQLSGIGERVSAGKAEVSINCRVTDNYQVSTYPSQVKNIEEYGEVTTTASGDRIRKIFTFQENRTKSIEKMEFSYEVQVSGLINKSYSDRFKLENEINSLQYTGNVPNSYKEKDNIQKLLGESAMRNKILEKSNLESQLNSIVSAMRGL